LKAVPWLRHLVHGWCVTSNVQVHVFPRVLTLTPYWTFNQSSICIHLSLHNAVFAARNIINWNTWRKVRVPWLIFMMTVMKFAVQWRQDNCGSSARSVPWRGL
jgi:hypothetical protein